MPNEYWNEELISDLDTGIDDCCKQMFVKVDKKTISDFYENAKRDKTFYEVVPVGASAIYSNDDDVDAIWWK